ncbi:MAG: RlpA-like double-psi beta-barrel domain-containing protein, partial [Hyphomicrobiaceae bacterium]
YVTNLSNNRTILVRINDRGPYAHDRVIDLSRRSARELGSENAGVTQVRVKFAGRAPLGGNDAHEQKFLASQQGHGHPTYAASPPSVTRGLAGTPSPVAVRSMPERAYEPQPTTQASAAQMPNGLTWRR